MNASVTYESYIHMYVHTLLYNACSTTPFKVYGHCHVYRTCVSCTSTETGIYMLQQSSLNEEITTKTDLCLLSCSVQPVFPLWLLVLSKGFGYMMNPWQRKALYGLLIPRMVSQTDLTLRSIMVVTTTHIANFILLVVMPFVGKEPPCSERHSVT